MTCPNCILANQELEAITEQNRRLRHALESLFENTFIDCTDGKLSEFIQKIEKAKRAIRNED